MYTHLIGQPVHALDTPVLLLDLDILESNILRMADTIITQGQKGWRPHTKGMKTPALAHKLLAAGAHGVTCAKLGEAEVMAAAGIADILVANQVVAPQKITRLVNLRRHADVKVAVDSRENADALDRAALDKGVVLNVLIEVDTGMERAGTLPGAPTLALARHIHACKGLHLAGLMTWESHVIRIKDLDEKKAAVDRALTDFTDTAQQCREEGIPIDIVSCGGTGTYQISAFQPGITELQAGGGIYGDAVYHYQFGVEHPFALTVRTTVTSRPAPDRVICDAGKKTMTGDAELPRPIGLPPVKNVSLSAEHGVVLLEEASDTPRVGDQFELVVGYSDTTVVLHDYLFGVREGVVETIWPLWGRGRLH
ncbi:MAG: DSD1 family PLP-dependent enzyme [Candidatus Latescibacteria bacterium]|nr:DSD1 family PLP-dependent enzyme [Candidatus Latescibacterota bacterium]